MKNPSCRKFRFLIPLAVLGFVGLFTYAVYALWNGVLADVIGVKAITYWQALGILLLAKILFGGFPGRGGRFGPSWRGRMMAQHWESLSEEQREKLREGRCHQFGDWPRSPGCDTEGAEPKGPGKPTGA